VNADPAHLTPSRSATGLTDDDIHRALDRLAKARVRLRDVTARVPVPSRSRVEAIERAHRAVADAAAVRDRRPDDPSADKTHALAEIAEVMALRREGFWSWRDYEAQVAPTVSDPRLREALLQAETELADAQANWDQVKVGIIAGSESAPDGDAVIDLTGDTPVIDTT
jgi:hypothetical protein